MGRTVRVPKRDLVSVAGLVRGPGGSKAAWSMGWFEGKGSSAPVYLDVH